MLFLRCFCNSLTRFRTLELLAHSFEALSQWPLVLFDCEQAKANALYLGIPAAT